VLARGAVILRRPFAGFFYVTGHVKFRGDGRWPPSRSGIPEEPGPDATTSLTYAEFLDAVGRMREVGFPIERDPAEAWPDFVGWRVNYEPAAYAVAAGVYAVPALWSGPRRHPVSPMAPIRPQRGHPPG
jgi:hypothetical protein